MGGSLPSEVSLEGRGETELLLGELNTRGAIGGTSTFLAPRTHSPASPLQSSAPTPSRFDLRERNLINQSAVVRRNVGRMRGRWREESL